MHKNTKILIIATFVAIILKISLYLSEGSVQTLPQQLPVICKETDPLRRTNYDFDFVSIDKTVVTVYENLLKPLENNFSRKIELCWIDNYDIFDIEIKSGNELIYEDPQAILTKDVRGNCYNFTEINISKYQNYSIKYSINNLLKINENDIFFGIHSYPLDSYIFDFTISPQKFDYIYTSSFIFPKDLKLIDEKITLFFDNRYEHSFSSSIPHTEADSRMAIHSETKNIPSNSLIKIHFQIVRSTYPSKFLFILFFIVSLIAGIFISFSDTFSEAVKRLFIWFGIFISLEVATTLFLSRPLAITYFEMVPIVVLIITFISVSVLRIIFNHSLDLAKLFKSKTSDKFLL